VFLTDLKQAGYVTVDWIRLAQDRNQWWVVNLAKNLRFQKKKKKLEIS